jgi:hypothetical protein
MILSRLTIFIDFLSHYPIFTGGMALSDLGSAFYRIFRNHKKT